MRHRRIALTPVLALTILGATAATARDIPLRNWSPPATWSAAPTGRSAPSTWSAASTGRSTLADVGAPAILVPFAPCRLADTRGNGFTGAYGAPQLVGGGAPRSFPIPSNPTCTGIAPGAVAFSLNFTVVAPPGTPPGGYLTVFPTGSPQPVVSTLNFGASSILANAAVVPAGTSGGISVFVNFSTDLIIDINGYYMGGGGSLNPGERLNLNATAPGWGTLTATNTTAAGNSAGVLGILNGNNTLTSAGTIGYNPGNGTGVWGWSPGSGRGVYGLSGTGPGVWGESQGGSGEGVHGKSAGGVGVVGESAQGGVAAVLGVNNTATNGTQGVGGYAGGAAVVYGVQGEIGSTATAGSAGVHGIAPNAGAGKVFGVIGDSASNFTDASGVLGRTDTPLNNTNTLYSIAGVRGESGGTFFRVGVLGVANLIGVFGGHHNGSGTGDAQGFLGYNPGTAYGVYANVGTIGCNGCVKQFVEPHPTDPSKTIHYVSLEGPEAGTYFRGTARTADKEYVIEVPDHFRWVADEEGMTVHLTPVGSPAILYVESQNLHQIVIRSNRETAFHYIVHGVRQAHKNFQVVVEGREFLPISLDRRMPEGWTEWTKRRLVENGTYHPDGSVNMETVRGLGWEKYLTEPEEK